MENSEKDIQRLVMEHGIDVPVLRVQVEEGRITLFLYGGGKLVVDVDGKQDAPAGSTAKNARPAKRVKL